MKAQEKATWTIKLPLKSKILVKVGDKVEIGDKLATFNDHLVEVFDYSGKLSSMDESKREEFNNFFQDKLIKEGDAFYDLGIFKGKICFPLSGLCLGMDEFKNLKIEKTETEKKEIFSPIEAKVKKVESGKMVLEFKAKEYVGKGLNQLKAWGEGKINVIDDIKSLNYELDNNILFTKNIDRAFLLKAQVVGAKGVVILASEKQVVSEDLGIGIGVPVLQLEEKIWQEFIKDNLKKDKKMLVNARMEKLLLVLE